MNYTRKQQKHLVRTTRVNVKSLAAEAKFIRKEALNSNDFSSTQLLMQHKNTKVRAESRRAQLLLAYFKGVPYKAVERNAKKSIDRTALIKKGHRAVSSARWLDWTQAVSFDEKDFLEWLNKE